MRVRQLSLGIALLTIGLMPPVHAQQAAQAPPSGHRTSSSFQHRPRSWTPC